MQEYISNNLKIIKKHIKKRKKLISNKNKLSILQEFKEWNDDIFLEKEKIWTLPDLTSNERFKNFCRSIKKEIN